MIQQIKAACKQTSAKLLLQSLPVTKNQQGTLGNPKIQKILKLCIHIKQFIRNTKLFFVRSELQFQEVKHSFGKNRFFFKRISSKRYEKISGIKFEWFQKYFRTTIKKIFLNYLFILYPHPHPCYKMFLFFIFL